MPGISNVFGSWRAGAALLAATLASAAVVPPAAAQTEEFPSEVSALCGEDESVAAGCPMRTGQVIAYCVPRGERLALSPETGEDEVSARPAVGFMVYRLSRGDTIQTSFPDEREGSAQQFVVHNRLDTNTRDLRIAFERRNVTYRYVRREEDGAPSTHAFSLFTPGGNPIVTFYCRDHGQ